MFFNIFLNLLFICFGIGLLEVCFNCIFIDIEVVCLMVICFFKIIFFSIDVLKELIF